MQLLNKVATHKNTVRPRLFELLGFDTKCRLLAIGFGIVGINFVIKRFIHRMNANCFSECNYLGLFYIANMNRKNGPFTIIKALKERPKMALHNM